ncbi:capsule assembly Wzi family protein [Flavisolibacter nicotianae]|uniref:capsule assembly Wzi family protein n=1 Tax=Flavisolibacter nicotianae TaxID=2364882 RepID=UPI0013C4BCD0|nr:capsule assembly Wzi family protein [Flavisolibacter nicotianae]
MKNCIAFAVLFFLLCKVGRSQVVPLGTPLLDESWRLKQVRGEADTNVSFTIRPLSLSALSRQASSTKQDELSFTTPLLNISGNRQFLLLPLTVKQQYNTHHPFGRNDGAMIQAKGYQSLVSAGFFAQAGHFSLQVQPEFVFAQNSAFPGFPAQFSDSLWASYYSLYSNIIDAPERFGSRAYRKFFPGQSSLRFQLKKFSLGISTENLWWGPGVRNALIMSNNAPGFPHLTFNTTEPLQLPFGTLEGQLVSGLLQQSGYLLPDTNRRLNGKPIYQQKPGGDRYLNGMVLSLQPKWTKGLFLGLSRVFYVNRSNMRSSFNGYLPVIGQVFKGSVADAVNEDSLGRDQLFSIFFRLLLPKEKAEVYAEFGRNDHAGNSRDLVMEPEHSSAFTIGLRKLFPTRKNGDLELTFELTNLQLPTTQLVREQQSWYTHNRARDGYTQLGQIIGAGIGPGGNSQSLGLKWINGLRQTGIQLERVVHNNDFYYSAFASTGEYWRHWVDISIQLNKSWRQNHFLYDARLAWVNSINYQWERDNDGKNIHAALSVSYVF